MATRENFTCSQRQHYQSIYSQGFGTESSQFFSKHAALPRSNFDMVYGKAYQPKGATKAQVLKGGCSSCRNQPESRYDGQWFSKEDYYVIDPTPGIVSGRHFSGV